MGNCCGLLDNSDSDQPTAEQRRQQSAEAAEKRHKEQERKGLISDASAARMKQEQERSRKVDEAVDQSGTDNNKLKWQVN